MEQIRIVKEMREEDERNGKTGVSIRPRYMVWENVLGAFSSNKGEDFRVVLEEIAKVSDANATIPQPKDGKWKHSGCIVGDGWSIAWRVLDAQFWGVPQRRKRIALIADFGGESAHEILFVRKGLSGHTDQSEPQRKETSSVTTRGIGVDIYNTALTGDKTCPLTAGGHTSTGTCPKVMTPVLLKIRSGCEGGGKGALIQTDKSATLSTLQDQTLFQPVTFSKVKRAQSVTDDETWKESDVANAFNVFDIGDVRTTEIVAGFCPEQSAKTRGIGYEEEVSPTLRSGVTPGVVYALDRASYNQGKNAQFDIGINESGTAQSLVAKGPGAVCYTVDQGGGKSACNVAEGKTFKLTCTHGGEPVVCYRYIVRRLTPLECERLQGYSDGWTDIGEWVDSNGKKRQTSDAARYKALGNSIALPPWKWVLKRLCACYERDATMASLFDGIGGFPFLWEQLNGKGSCLWASEIEEFPIAVTKKRIGGD